MKAIITITKSYTNQDGSIAGMFRVEAEKATKTTRHALVDLEGMECEVRAAGQVDSNAHVEPVDQHILKGIRAKLEVIMQEVDEALAPLMAPAPPQDALDFERITAENGETGADEGQGSHEDSETAHRADGEAEDAGEGMA
jgi:hypothetical protein